MSILTAGRPTKKARAIAAVQAKDEGDVRLNVNIPKRLHKALKRKAVEDDSTTTALVIKALNDHLSK